MKKKNTRKFTMPVYFIVKYFNSKFPGGWASVPFFPPQCIPMVVDAQLYEWYYVSVEVFSEEIRKNKKCIK